MTFNLTGSRITLETNLRARACSCGSFYIGLINSVRGTKPWAGALDHIRRKQAEAVIECNVTNRLKAQLL